MARKKKARSAVHAALLRRAHSDGTYDQLYLSCEGRCSICGRSPEEIAKTTGKKIRRLDIDHNHSSLKLRNLLCRGCNIRLRRGLNSDWLYRAAAYLRAHGE